MFFENVFKKHTDNVSKHYRVRDLHHGCLEVYRKKNALGFGIFDFFGDELAQAFYFHACSINNFIVIKHDLVFENGFFTIFILENYPGIAGLFDYSSLFATKKVKCPHMSNMSF